VSHTIFSPSLLLSFDAATMLAESPRISKRLPATHSGDALSSFRLNLTQEGIALALIDDQLLSYLAEVVGDCISLSSERFPSYEVLSIDRLEQQVR
jgi:hypothetical protein